jgi:hypothetical protein
MRSTSAPSSWKRFCVSGDSSIAVISLCSRSSAAAGVPAGATAEPTVGEAPIPALEVPDEVLEVPSFLRDG